MQCVIDVKLYNRSQITRTFLCWNSLTQSIFLLKKFVGEQQAVDTQDFLLNTCQADK